MLYFFPSAGFCRTALLFLEVFLTALDGHENQFDFFNVVAKFLVNA
jgi:hypothetical protein